MMTNDDYRHFVCIAAGENPKSIMEEYDKNKKVDPYIVYKYEDAEQIHHKYIEYYTQILNNENLLYEYGEEDIKETLDELKSMSSDEFFNNYLISDFDVDSHGNAISTNNKNGRWAYYQLGKAFSIPFLTKDGREVFQAKKGEIDWDKIHLNGGHIYERAWEMVMENSSPIDDYEKQIFENMKDKVTYFKKFETKENYVVSNTAFWGYAFVSDKTGWQEASETDDQFTWMSNFYDLFIKPLDDNILLTIYECTK